MGSLLKEETNCCDIMIDVKEKLSERDNYTSEFAILSLCVGMSLPCIYLFFLHTCRFLLCAFKLSLSLSQLSE